MDTTGSIQPHSLVTLYSAAEVNRISGFGAAMARLGARELADLYTDLCASAPRRHRREMRYFEGRSGTTSSGEQSNRREEHLAVALRNAFSGSRSLVLMPGRTLTLLDYQTPMKERRNDKGIGKLDLFGVIAGTLPCVVELKVPKADGGCSDTPLRAFLEALAYCAIIEANRDDIMAEAEATFHIQLTGDRPALCVMAPERYWQAYLEHPKSVGWWPALGKLAKDLAATLGLEAHFVALKDAGLEMGLAGNPPRLTGECQPVSVASLVTALDSRACDDAFGASTGQ